MNAHPVLNFGFAQVLQSPRPGAHLAQDIGGSFGYHDVSGISTIHHALCDVDATTGDISIRIDVRDPINGTRVDSHAQLDVGRGAERFRQFESAPDRGFGVTKKDKRHPVTGGQSDQLVVSSCSLERRGVPNGFLQIVKNLLLVVHVERGVGDDVHKEDMGDLKGLLGRFLSVSQSVPLDVTWAGKQCKKKLAPVT